MQELLYILKIAPDPELKAELARRLGLEKAPNYARVATMAPLSNFGYTPGTEGELVRIDTGGLLVGVSERPEVPRQYVPWQNVAYVGDGDLAQETTLLQREAEAAGMTLQELIEAAGEPET